MKFLKCFTAVFVMVSSCRGNGTTVNINDQNIDKLVEAINDFTFDFHRLSTENSTTVFSTFGLSTVLSMLYHGSNGTTADELRRVLRFHSVGLDDDSAIQSSYKSILESLALSDSSTVFHVANAIVSEKTFAIKPEYKSLVQDVYHSQLWEVDLAHSAENVTDEINEWVKDATHDKIPKLLDEPLNSDTVLALLTVVHFDGHWTEKFKTDQTWEETFYNNGLGSGATSVEMMHQRARFMYFNDVEDTDSEVLELPYEGGSFSMWILLTRGGPEGLDYLESKLTADSIHRLKGSMRDFVVDLSLPKFKVNCGGDVSSTLKRLGITAVFQEANLEGISEDNLVVSSVIHKAVIQVDEIGTEAAAGSGDIVTDEDDIEIGENEHTSFSVNHPFLFLIVDNRNGVVHFMGRVNEM